ncbi:Store-operated calcium entry-associated regulatory factor [Geranomyces variabilis]|nr:Store-operated calcium entry-associated regulatory factor [Geranomyces variabilis]
MPSQPAAAAPRARSLRRRIWPSALAIVLALLALLLTSQPVVEAARKDNKVLMTDIQALTLYKGRKTTGQRTSPVPQFKCVGGDACRDAQPDVIQCRVTGLNGREPQWRCEAELQDLYKFGTTEVVCEGYDYAEDPYVLAGSCGVEYTLHRTPKWFEAQQQRGKGSKAGGASSYRDRARAAGAGAASAGQGIIDEGLIPWIKSLLPFGLGALLPGRTLLSWIPGANRFPFSLLFGTSAAHDSTYFSTDDSSRGAFMKTGWSTPSVIWSLVLGLFTYSVYQTCCGQRRRPAGSHGGPGGYPPTAPPYDDNDTPPPYNSHHQYPGAAGQGRGWTGMDTFWSALGLSQLARGFANTRNSNARNHENTRRSSANYPSAFDDNSDDDYAGRTRRTSPRASTRRQNERYDPRAGASSSSASAPPPFAPSSSSSNEDNVRTTTGFGGTRRR